MSEKLNKVIANLPQSFSTAEQKQARDNIGAMAESASSLFYSTSNPSAFISGVDRDSNLSGNGRTVPLGLNTSITIDKYGDSASLTYDSFSLVGNGGTPLLSADRTDIYMSGHAGNASSPYTANYGLQGMHAYGTDTYNHITATATLRYSGGTFVEGDDSAKIKATGLTLHTTADGDQLVDASSVVRWNSYSSMSSFTGCSANNNITGNGTSSSPLGLSSEVWFTSYGASARLRYDQLGMYTETGNTYTEIDRGALHVLQRTGSLDYQAEYGHFYGTGMHYSHSNMSDVKLSANWEGLYIETANGIDSASSRFDASSLQFKDGSGNLHVVDSASIDKWNSSLWNESANSLSTGFGGNQATAASQFNDGAGNWTCRRVKADGLPDQNLYGFQSKPNGTGTAYMVNPAGAFIQYQPTYFCYLYHKTGSVYDDLDTSFYPTGLTANARLDFVNLCSAASANIKTDTYHGNTAIMNPGDSATMWYIATADIWTDGINNVPV